MTAAKIASPIRSGTICDLDPPPFRWYVTAEMIADMTVIY
jgi:hypothetical protein